MDDVFTIAKAEKPLPLVFDSPHSGTIWPADFKPATKETSILSTTDLYIDDLFSNVPDHGAALLCAKFPRAYIDVNRAADDIDPQVIAGDWPGTALPSVRSDAGIGLIRRLLKPGTPLYNRPLKAEQIQARLDHYYIPYHDALQELIDEAHYNFGQVYFIDCHSMPLATAFPKHTKGIIGHQEIASDFVLGNRDGTTCHPDFLHTIHDFLKSEGYRVTINDPFKGVELIRRHGQPTRGKQALQLEINKSLYMYEETLEKSKDYDDFKKQMDKLIAFIADYTSAQLQDLAAD